MAQRKNTTDISGVPVSIRCSASISSGIVKESCFALVMFTVLIVGKEVLEPIVKRYENKKNRKYFRGDAAFAKPEIYDYLEENGYLYAIRLPANDILSVASYRQSCKYSLRNAG